MRPVPRRRLPVVVGLALVAVVAFGGVWLVRGGQLLGPSSPAVARFVDETATSGIEHTFGGGPTASTGGGMAVLDCDEDGRPDLYLAGGDGPAALFRNASPVGGPLRFERVPSAPLDRSRVTGAYPLDIDGDGHPDLAVLGVGETHLVRGLGGCAFEPADATFAFDAGRSWATAFSATWEGTNVLPTMALGSYLVLGEDGETAPSYDCAPNAMVRPASASATTYAPASPLEPGFCTLSMLFSDWDGSGRRDLRVSNDRQYYIGGSEQLFRVAPGEPPRAYTEADGWRRLVIFGMGIASQDLTGDGRPEVYLTSQADNKLQTLARDGGPSRPSYDDMAQAAGVLATQPYTGGQDLPSTAWHPQFADVNDDGIVDLFVSKGNVESQPDYASKDPSNLLLGRGDGTFVESGEAAGIVTFARGRGAALVDLDLDGRLDLVQVNLGEPAMVWRNTGVASGAGHWLAVLVRQPAPNVDAIGGWLEVRTPGSTFRRELVVGGGHISGQLGWEHVGLGDATSADVRVTWPDGEVGPWLKMDADMFGVVERGASTVVPWTPGAGAP